MTKIKPGPDTVFFLQLVHKVNPNYFKKYPIQCGKYQRMFPGDKQLGKAPCQTYNRIEGNGTKFRTRKAS